MWRARKKFARLKSARGLKPTLPQEKGQDGARTVVRFVTVAEAAGAEAVGFVADLVAGSAQVRPQGRWQEGRRGP